MMNATIKIFIVVVIVSFTIQDVKATDWNQIADLEGFWRFSVGDNMKWADPDFDDSKWDFVRVPANWDDFYPGYNGFGWYRKTFEVRTLPPHDNLAFILGDIDDVDEVFVNGKKIGQTGSFPPNNETAYNINRIYFVDNDLLRKGENTIAIRVYDEGREGGMVGHYDIGLFYDNDKALLDLDLSGTWKFSIYRETNLYDFDFDDSGWDELTVPGNWEGQGYADFDGFAWYRRKFTVPARLTNQKMYLVLGKIDDRDKVYLNGKIVGRTEYLDEYSGFRKYGLWQLYRVYELPPDALQRNNIIVVEVKDEQLQGGIYEGPIGLMNEQNARVIEKRNEDLFHETPIERVINFFFDF
jgi:sialate O-acetylesterase